jgi:hypothetical protein
MPIFKLHHATQPHFSHANPQEFTPENFDHVADVEADDLGEVFEKTNHIEVPWPENPGATMIVSANSVRSTSVGDIVVDETGVRHRCLPIGWQVV